MYFYCRVCVLYFIERIFSLYVVWSEYFIHVKSEWNAREHEPAITKNIIVSGLLPTERITSGTSLYIRVKQLLLWKVNFYYLRVAVFSLSFEVNIHSFRIRFHSKKFRECKRVKMYCCIVNINVQINCANRFW